MSDESRISGSGDSVLSDSVSSSDSELSSDSVLSSESALSSDSLLSSDFLSSASDLSRFLGSSAVFDFSCLLSSSSGFSLSSVSGLSEGFSLSLFSCLIFSSSPGTVDTSSWFELSVAMKSSKFFSSSSEGWEMTSPPRLSSSVGESSLESDCSDLTSESVSGRFPAEFTSSISVSVES